MRRRTTIGLLTLALFYGSAVQAQETPLVRGARSLSFSLSDGGSPAATFGVWKMRSDRMNVGWLIGLQGAREWATTTQAENELKRSHTGFSITFGPQLRRYVEPVQRVTGFVQTGLAAGYGYNTTEFEGVADGSDHGVQLTGDLGLGLEWFPTDRVSISGNTGLSLGVHYRTQDREDNNQVAWQLRANTFTTALSFRIYLPPTA